MKELSIEQKARRYDEAIEIANNLYKDAVEMENNMTTKTCEIIFPELKDEDERIRKALMQNLKERFGTKGNMGEGLNMPDVLAWLEKQGEQKPIDPDTLIQQRVNALADIIAEQKPADKVEHQFKVGDTITDPTDSTFTFHINAIKDGKYIESDKDWILIKEADSDYELVEQKTIKWSEEDKNHVKSILSTIKCCKAQFPNSQAVVEAYNADIEWLKSLKDRYTWKPSEEQLAAVKEAACYSSVLSEKTIDNLVSLSKQLKKLMDE